MTGALLTARGVADLLDVSAETILRWTRDGKLPAIAVAKPPPAHHHPKPAPVIPGPAPGTTPRPIAPDPTATSPGTATPTTTPASTGGVLGSACRPARSDFSPTPSRRGLRLVSQRTGRQYEYRQ